MEKFFEFLANHPYLVGTWVALALSYLFIDQKSKGSIVSANMVGIMTNDGAKLIDIRDPKDFKEGHITGSRNIPFSQLKNHVEELKNSNVPLIIVCNMGHTASSAIQMIGNPKATRLDGGIYGWRSSGLPLVKGR